MAKQVLVMLLGMLVLTACGLAPYNIRHQALPVDAPAQDNNMVHQAGNKIVDGQGQPLFLKGVIVLGWLQWEGTIWNTGLQSEGEIKRKLIHAIGKDAFTDFQTRLYRAFITEKDMAAMKALGFNAIRVPFNHTLLEDDDNPYHYKQTGWELLDTLLAYCGKYGLYAILDLHAAPGGQAGLFTADPDPVKLWQSGDDQKRTIALWKAIAERYKDKEIIAGYDLINEPAFPNGDQLRDLYADIIAAIRQVDQKHMILVEGNAYATDFSAFRDPLSCNMVYSYHTYNVIFGDKSRKQLADLKKIAGAQGVPIWNGEFGANTIGWVRESVALFHDPQNDGWIFWPWKRVQSNADRRYRHLYGIKTAASWKAVQRCLTAWFFKPGKEAVMAGLNDFLESVNIDHCELDQEMADALK